MTFAILILRCQTSYRSAGTHNSLHFLTRETIDRVSDIVFASVPRAIEGHGPFDREFPLIGETLKEDRKFVLRSLLRCSDGQCLPMVAAIAGFGCYAARETVTLRTFITQPLIDLLRLAYRDQETKN